MKGDRGLPGLAGAEGLKGLEGDKGKHFLDLRSSLKLVNNSRTYLKVQPVRQV